MSTPASRGNGEGGKRIPLSQLWKGRKRHPVSRVLRNVSFHLWLLLVAGSVAIAFLLTPTLETAPHPYNIGDVVLKDVKADRDLLIEDRDATEKKRTVASGKVLPVYDFDPSVFPEIEGLLHTLFASVRSSREEKGQEANVGGKEELEKILGFSLSEKEYQLLTDEEFNRRVVTTTVALLAPLMQRGVVSNKEILLSEKIVVRNIKTGRETVREDVQSLVDYGEAKEAIKEAARGEAGKAIPRKFRGLTTRLAENLVFPNLTFNRQETDRRRQEAKAQVKPVLFQITKGEIVLNKGEVVTGEGCLKLEALRHGWRHGSKVLVILGVALLACLFTLSLYHFSARNIKKFVLGFRDLLFLMLVLVVTLLITRASVFMADALGETVPFLPSAAYYYFFPIAAGAMLVRLVLNSEVALIYAIFSSLLSGVLLKEGVFFPVYYLVGSIVGAHALAWCNQRSTLLKAGFIVGLTNLLLVLFNSLIDGSFLEMRIFLELLLGLAGGVTAGMVVLGLTPVVESVFGYTTDIKLLELANLDQPILKDMLMRAPGTYHHSMVVGNLVETAAKAINVNPLLARIIAYYHDIGKIKKPQYFVENQRAGDNRHDKLAPSMSSLILVSHVKDGIEVAKKHRLGRKIIDAIAQHHGTRLIVFFYQKAREQANPGGQDVDEQDFRYLGPKPQTREAGLVMLADAVEAASRTLDDPTPARIQGLVQKIINDIFIDGQLDECELTLKDIHEIGKSFNIILNAVHHHRIEYPEPATEEGKKNGGVGPRSTKTKKSAAGKSSTNSRKDIKRLGVSR